MTNTNSQSWGTTNREPVGEANKFKIVSLDERELVWEEEGQKGSLQRKK